MPHIDANGERLRYEDAGSGPAVLLIHSMGADWTMWRDQIAALSDRYRCIAFDCRGHGGSSYNARFTVAGAAADLKAGLDALGVGSCHLVGMAMGGPIAVSFAAQWPDAVRSVTVADGFVDMREVGGARIPEWARTIRSTTMTEFGRRYAEMRLTPSASRRARDELAAAIAKVPPEAYIDVMKAIFDGIEFTRRSRVHPRAGAGDLGRGGRRHPPPPLAADRRPDPRRAARDDPRRGPHLEPRPARGVQPAAGGFPRRAGGVRGHAGALHDRGGELYTVAGNEGVGLKANSMAQLTVRKISPEVVSALKRRAAANGRSAEAEHREILRASLLDTETDFAARAEALRRRLRSSVDSSETIRADRDRDDPA